METRTYQVYKFHELTKEQQKKVLDNYRYWNVEGDWQGFVIDEWIEKLKEFGFADATISFSGFGSQGDGASFTAKDVNIDTFLKKTDTTKLYPYSKNTSAYFWLERIDHHYSHEYSVRVRWEWDNDRDEHLSEVEEEQLEDISKFMELKRRKLSIELYNDLQSEYEYLTSDEALTEFWNENSGYFFTADGKLDTTK